MAAQIKLDQVGLSAGVAGDSRDDGLATGAKVTITNAGGGACTCRFLDKPVEDTSAVLAQESPTVWSFNPQSGVYNDYLIELTETATNTVDVKAFGIPMPNSGLIIPAHQARGNRLVHLASASGDKSIAAAGSTHNVSLSGRKYMGYWPRLRSLFLKVEQLSGSIASTSGSTAVKEVIWRPTYGGTNPLIRSTFADALTEAKLAPGQSVIVMDASLSTTFALPNSETEGESKVSLRAPREAGTYTITAGSSDVLDDFVSVEAPPGTTLVFSASAAGPSSTFFKVTNEKINFQIRGNVTVTGAGNRSLVRDTSVAAASVERTLTIADRSAALSAGFITLAGNSRVYVTGPRVVASASSGAIAAISGTPTIAFEFAQGSGLPSAAYAGWPGTVTINTHPLAGYIAADQVSTDWPEGTPVLVKDALSKLAARDFAVAAHAANIQYNRNKIVLIASGSGALELGVAASGHASAPVIDVMIWIKANSGVTSLSAHADYGQVGNPFVNFDPTKGYQAFFTRFNFGGTDICYAVSGKVIV